MLFIGQFQPELAAEYIYIMKDEGTVSTSNQVSGVCLLRGRICCARFSRRSQQSWCKTPRQKDGSMSIPVPVASPSFVTVQVLHTKAP